MFQTRTFEYKYGTWVPVEIFCPEDSVWIDLSRQPRPHNVTFAGPSWEQIKSRLIR